MAGKWDDAITQLRDAAYPDQRDYDAEWAALRAGIEADEGFTAKERKSVLRRVELAQQFQQAEFDRRPAPEPAEAPEDPEFDEPMTLPDPPEGEVLPDKARELGLKRHKRRR